MQFRRLLGVAMACLGGALLVVACARTPPEQQLRETAAAMQHAVEARDTGALRELLAEDFIGPDGLDRQGAGRLAQAMFLRHRAVGVTLGPLQVSMHPDGEHATVACSVALTGGEGGVLPDAARVYQVESGWRLVGGDWRMTSLGWNAPGG